MKSVVIVTPTTGSPELKECLKSVMLQDYVGPLRHMIVIDGYGSNLAFVEHSNQTLISYLGPHKDYLLLHDNVGSDGWYGHRVFAAMPYLVNDDIVMFLDQDNWLEPNHVSDMVKVIENGYDWAYSLRSIYDKNGHYICEDNCESLGKWPIWGTNTNYHIDTSCFAVPREILVRGICGAWYGKWGADRQFFNILKQHYPNFGCTGKHSLNYRLGGNEGSVQPEFFHQGNIVMAKHYNMQIGQKWPWEEVNV